MNTLEQDDAEVRRRVAEITRKITVLRVNEKTLGRKILSYQDIETKLRKVRIIDRVFLYLILFS